MGTPDWFAWLGGATTFAFTSTSGLFTARKEARSRGGLYWRAYHTANGKLHRAYLGKTSDLTLDHLNSVAATLGASVLVEPPGPNPDSVPSNLLTTKLNIPPVRAQLVNRSRLFERLEAGLRGKLTLVAAPAGFGKTTLISAWAADLQVSDWGVAWLSLDEADSDPLRFLTYLVAALGTVAPTLDAGVLGEFRGPHPPPANSVLTTLLNEITRLPNKVVLVLDDYHVIDAPAVDQALTFLLEHLPPQMHLVIVTREDPSLPLARLRARGQLCELRAADLRFTPAEAAEFLNSVMGLGLSPDNIAALETRTEGWIAGLQLAALSMQGHKETTKFIQSFTGSHHFVMDYLVEEVLRQQPYSVQTFLMHTSILDRLCGPLCDAVLCGPDGSGQDTLEYLERANMFIVPLDNERRWYRYHHLFADLLRQRLLQGAHQTTTSPSGVAESSVAKLHTRASQWYEANGLKLEAFRHAAAANDVDRAARLIEGEGVPRHLQGATATVLDWLASLPKRELDARPLLWWKYASLLLVRGKVTGVEEKLQAAEAAMQQLQGSPHDIETDDKARNLIGQIAAARAVLAVPRYEVETMLTQAHRALEFLSPNNLEVLATVNWTLGVAYQQQGDRAAARNAFTESISLSQACGDMFTTVMATKGLADLQVAENQLRDALEAFHRVLQLLGDRALPVACEAHLALAGIYYEWNDLEAAERHGQQSLQLARQFDKAVDRFILSEVLLARLKLAQGDVTGAAVFLHEANQSVREGNFVHRRPEVAAVQVLILLAQGDVAAAAQLALAHELPINQARVHLAQDDATTALSLLEPLRREAEAKGWADERLKVMVLQAVALYAYGRQDQALQLLSAVLALAEPEGFIRSFVDEGRSMQGLLQEAWDKDTTRSYVHQLLAAFEKTGEAETVDRSERVSGRAPSTQILLEPLSERELEVLRLLRTELNGPEIAAAMMVSLHTVRTHTNKIYNKLDVNNRRAAVRRAENLGLF